MIFSVIFLVVEVVDFLVSIHKLFSSSHACWLICLYVILIHLTSLERSFYLNNMLNTRILLYLKISPIRSPKYLFIGRSACVFSVVNIHLQSQE